MYGRFGRQQIVYQNCHTILDETPEEGALWLGDYTAALDLKFLNSKNIRTVLTVAAGLPVAYQQQSGIFHKTYQALDIESYNISKHFADTFSLIEVGLKKGSVLVHCAAGVSRSATIVISYLMRKKQMTYQTAHNYVKKCRPYICPNFGFVRQLRNFERTLSQQQKLEKMKEQTNPTLLDGEQTQNAKNIDQEEEKSSSYPTISGYSQPKQFTLKVQSKQMNLNSKQGKINSLVENIQEPNIVTYNATTDKLTTSNKFNGNTKKQQLPSINKYK